MRFFTKILLFFSVPALILSLLAVPSLRHGDKAPRGDAWLALADAGVEYLAPLGWRVVDPLTTSEASADSLWSMATPPLATTHAARLEDLRTGTTVLLYAGEREALTSMALASDSYYLDSVMVERAPTERWSTVDRTELQVERAWYKAGSLNGSDATMLLAWGARGARAVVVNAGGPSASFDAAAVEDLLRNLRLSD